MACDYTVVIDSGPGIYYRVGAYDGVGLNHCPRHDLGTRLQHHSGVDPSCRMHKRRKGKALGRQFLKYLHPAIAADDLSQAIDQ